MLLFPFYNGDTPVSKENSIKNFTRIPGPVYALQLERMSSPKIAGERRPILSEGGSSRFREQQIDTESAEPPSLNGTCCI
jgi:hypothetical protein